VVEVVVRGGGSTMRVGVDVVVGSGSFILDGRAAVEVGTTEVEAGLALKMLKGNCSARC